MVTFAEIEETLEKATFTPEQSRGIAKAIEMAQRKTQEEVETDLRMWMEERFVTKEEFQKEMGALRVEMGTLRVEMGGLRAEMIKWMFVFWVGQIAAFAAVLKLLGK